ncbi:MAG: Hsp20/alpha crystallin family protein [Candidatus Syntropharchaeia archaeon]
MGKKKDPIEEIFREFYEKLEEMFREIGKAEPIVFGFSMTGKPEFGFPWVKFDAEERKPFIDVIESDDEIRVVAEIPGVEKEDIKLSATETTLDIRASGEKRSYSERVDLPSPVDPESSKASYKNGVLEVVLKKTGKEKGKTINVS